MSQCASHATGSQGCLACVLACLAIRRMVFRTSLAAGRFLCWIPRALQQMYLDGKSRAGQVNTAPVHCRRRDAAVCRHTSHTCRGLECSSVNDALTSSSDGTRVAVTIQRASRLLSRHGLASCCAETKLQSFKVNDRGSPRGASGTLHQRAGDVRRCHGVRWQQIS